jgi:hypothetical protein
MLSTSREAGTTDANIDSTEWRPRLDITKRYIYEQSDRSAAFASPIGLSFL